MKKHYNMTREEWEKIRLAILSKTHDESQTAEAMLYFMELEDDDSLEELGVESWEVTS